MIYSFLWRDKSLIKTNQRWIYYRQVTSLEKCLQIKQRWKGRLQDKGNQQRSSQYSVQKLLLWEVANLEDWDTPNGINSPIHKSFPLLYGGRAECAAHRIKMRREKRATQEKKLHGEPPKQTIKSSSFWKSLDVAERTRRFSASDLNKMALSTDPLVVRVCKDMTSRETHGYMMNMQSGLFFCPSRVGAGGNKVAGESLCWTTVLS